MPPKLRSAVSLWIVTAATLLAAIMRFIRLDDLAPAAWYDEVWFALRARELLQGAPPVVFYETTFGGANAGLVYLTAFVQALGMDTITSARWVLAMAGVMAVPLGYRCYKRLAVSSQRSANGIGPVLAAVFLAYTMFVVIITRVGMESGMVIAVALLVIWQIARNKWSGWMLAGVVLGVAQYNGLHARFIIPVAGYFVLDLLITSKDRKRILLGALLMAGAGLVVILPLILFFVREPEWLTARAGFVAQSGIDKYIFNLVQIARVFTVEGSFDPKTTVPGSPLLDLVQGIGFYAGLCWCVWNVVRSRMARLLIVWLVVASLPGLLTDGPNLQRMIGIAAPLAGIVAVGWVTVYQVIGRFISQGPRGEGPLAPTFSVIGIGLLVVSVGWHAYLIFVRWPQEPKMGAQFTAPPVEMAREAISRVGEEVIFAERIPESEDIIGWEFLLPGTGVTRLDFRKCLPVPHERDQATSYLVLDAETVDKLRGMYPAAYLRDQDVDLWQDTAAWITIPAGVDAPRPVNQVGVEFGEGITLYGYEWSTNTLHPGETLFLTLYWHATEDVEVDYTAFTHIGTGLDGTTVVAQRDGQPCVGLYPTSQWQAGEIVTDSFVITLPNDVTAGEYPVAVGWYSFPALERLPLVEADEGLPDNRAVIGVVEIVP